MKKKITLKQIAKELDVSISTVSKALRNSEEIGKETKEKIQAFAKLYNYKPNNIALSLKNRKTKTIGVIIPEIVHHFFSKVIQGVESQANLRGYNVIIALSNEAFDKEVINMEMLANGSIDGFILSVSKETLLLQDYHHFNETLNQGMPIVMFDRVIHEIECDKVIVNDFESAQKATQKLLDNGCKTIAMITTKDYVNVGKLRTEGYLKALNDFNIEPQSDLILKVDDNLTSSYYLENLESEIYLMLSNNKNIDGILAVNELYAISAIKAAKALKRNIPDDIQIIGFTDGVLSQHATPALTTVRQHGEKIGKKAVELLINQLENEVTQNSPKTIIVNTNLIERETTK